LKKNLVPVNFFFFFANVVPVKIWNIMCQKKKYQSHCGRQRCCIPCHLWILLILPVLSTQSLNSIVSVAQLAPSSYCSCHSAPTTRMMKHGNNNTFVPGKVSDRYYKSCKREKEREQYLVWNFLYKINSSHCASSGNRFRYRTDICFLPINSNLRT